MHILRVFQPFPRQKFFLSLLAVSLSFRALTSISFPPFHIHLSIASSPFAPISRRHTMFGRNGFGFGFGFCGSSFVVRAPPPPLHHLSHVPPPPPLRGWVHPLSMHLEPPCLAAPFVPPPHWDYPSDEHPASHREVPPLPLCAPWDRHDKPRQNG